jgi:hypothetical protein
MKPLHSAPLTKEDTHIWLRINLPLRKPAPRPLLMVAYLEADRRAAALMLGWRRFRHLTREPMHAPNVWWLRDESEPRYQPVGGQL